MKTNGNDRVHPRTEYDGGSLTKRELFAIHILAAVIARGTPVGAEMYAASVDGADGLIEALNETPTPQDGFTNS